MKTNKLIPLILLALLLTVSCKTEVKTLLLNGENLDNWTIVAPDSVAPESLFWIENGVLKTSGVPNGFIRTNDIYENYTLHVEWRWTAEPKNSGVLLHANGPDMVWPNCIEAQLMAGNAGDIVLIGKGAGITVSDTVYAVESEANRFKVIKKMEESSEKPAGEWNVYEIEAEGNEIEITVNGVLQNEGSAATLTSGHICLQSEGGPMEFRNIYLVRED